MGKPKGPKGPEVGLVFPQDKKGGRCVLLFVAAPLTFVGEEWERVVVVQSGSSMPNPMSQHPTHLQWLDLR